MKIFLLIILLAPKWSDFVTYSLILELYKRIVIIKAPERCEHGAFVFLILLFLEKRLTYIFVVEYVILTVESIGISNVCASEPSAEGILTLILPDMF